MLTINHMISRTTVSLILLYCVVQQACAFRDSYEKFKKAGAEVVGISGDDPSSHKVSPSLFLCRKTSDLLYIICLN